MARIGSFDETLRPEAWFDAEAVVEGIFVDDLIGDGGPPPPTFLAAWAVGCNAIIQAGSAVA